VPPSDWLPPLVAHLADPAVAIVAPRILPPEDRGPGWLERFIAARSPLDMGPGEGEVVPGTRVSFVPTAALVFRVGALREPFAANLRFGEDIDMVWRVRDAGWSVRYEPAVTVRHHGEPGTWRGLLSRRRQYGTSAAPLARRHPGRLAPLAVRPWPALAAFLLLAQRLLPAAAVAAALSLSGARRTADLGIPAKQALGSSALAVPQAVVGLGRFATQLCSPLLLAAVLSRRGRRAATMLLAAPPLVEWLRRRPGIDPVRWTIGSVADDVAYGVGVWTGCIRERTLIPMMPSMARGHDPTVVEFGDKAPVASAESNPGNTK
jgi:mycofactocin system glycosyltransferase